VDHDHNIYFKEIRRGWWNPDEIIEQLLDSIKCHRVVDVHIETVAFQRWLKFYIEKERKELGLYFRSSEIKRSSHVSKNDRLDRIGPFLRAGKIFVPKDDPEYDNIKREMREYPYGRYDDILDTLADAIQVLRPPGVRKQREDNFYRPPCRLDGVNFQTGYSTWSAGR
jgi:predicted phage terminase large subunit-like protein